MCKRLFDFEKDILKGNEIELNMLSEEEINEKYQKGEARIVTEQGSIKLPLIKDAFSSEKYERRPIYQRRITWDNRKRSRLIESFIMNIPVPPVFMYEVNYGRYEVMDGLQRITAIMDFYNDLYELEGLTEWAELNGKKYSQLPKNVREGIDRRQISVVSLLKESAKSELQEQKMKRMVFERLNTGGVKLEDQEIRNALYDGKFNQMCLKLSENQVFRKLWGIPNEIIDDEKNSELEKLDAIDSLDVTEELATNNLYRRMYDVELVLRFFSMRHVEEYTGQLADFMDKCLISGNKILDGDVSRKNKLESVFVETINKANKLFGKIAYCQYKEIRGNYGWSKPQKMIYDSLMLSLCEIDIDEDILIDSDNVKQYMEKEYMQQADLFNGKKQSKNDIIARKKFFDKVIMNIIEGKMNE